MNLSPAEMEEEIRILRTRAENAEDELKRAAKRIKALEKDRDWSDRIAEERALVHRNTVVRLEIQIALDVARERFVKAEKALEER